MKFPLIIFCIGVLLACSSPAEQPDISENTPELQNSDLTDSLDHYLNMVLDSLSEQEYTNKLAKACKEHFDRSRIKFNPEILTTQFITDNFELLQYDSMNVLTVNYADWTWEEPSLLLYFIDQYGTLIHEDSIRGCHYHNGQLSAEDWNDDGTDELIFRMHFPTSSVYHDNYILTVYEFDGNKKLSPVFDLIEKTRDCGIPVDQNYGKEIVRNYTWIDSKNIRITETVYGFDCESSERDKPVQYERTISSSNYRMRWDDVKGKFVK